MSEIEYLAIPYSHKNLHVREFRAYIADSITAMLAKEGRVIYSPISSWHHISIRFGLATDWEACAKADKEFLKIAKRLLIVCLPGWKESVGVQAEIKEAEELGKPIEYIDPEAYQDFTFKWRVE